MEEKVKLKPLGLKELNKILKSDRKNYKIYILVPIEPITQWNLITIALEFDENDWLLFDDGFSLQGDGGSLSRMKEALLNIKGVKIYIKVYKNKKMEKLKGLELTWKKYKKGLYNIEMFDESPFLGILNKIKEIGYDNML
ncbi:MAG: hypothetical protein JXB17_07905 [Bacteroidales bacterium]|nr:hypothetical protein [Bacteroidales bacterium]